ncbi:MAG: Holliday junction branch migration protein RuvA [Arachidicoccus sp.]|nr:Holliday junction branch migration protein RuvA [Arachidicoccus sp.]
MIAFLQGEFVNKTPANVIVNVGGVGYDVNISLNTYSAIAELKNGLLYTYLQITENAHTLYGFADINEKNLFIQLISVSGVGASTARMMLSGMKPDEIIKAIVQSNTPQLEKIKGIGRKTAERLIVELKEKLAKSHDINTASPVIAISSIESDALEALMALGINRNMAENAIKKTLRTPENTHSLEILIKNSLKNL